MMPEVTELIPHRGRYLLLRSLVSREGDTLIAEGDFSPEDVEGHFPGAPVVPGVLLLEGLAQTMACLAALRAEGEAPAGRPFLAGFEKVRFRTPVLPPATVRYRVSIEEERMGLVIGRGQATVDGKRACDARLTAAILPVEGDGAGS